MISGTTRVEPGLAAAGTAAPARGSSPRVKVNPFSYQSDVWKDSDGQRETPWHEGIEIKC